MAGKFYPMGGKKIFFGLYMDVGSFFEVNRVKVAKLNSDNWAVVLDICKKHLELKLRQRTLSGVYSEANLGSDPFDHYVGLAYEKILTGAWEWKDGRSLSEQMIRIIDSELSKEVRRKNAGTSHLSHQVYPGDDQLEFYREEEPEIKPVDRTVNKAKLDAIAKACEDDDELSFIVECLKEGKKRAEIADLMGIKPKQLDKLREKLLRRIQTTQM